MPGPRPSRRPTTLVVAVAAVVAAAVIVPSGAPSRTRPQPCDGGRYFVDGGVVLVPGGPAPDVVVVEDTVEVLSGCPAIAFKSRLVRSGTRIKAIFSGCQGLAGNVTLRGKIAAGCQTMKATFRGKKARIRTRFTATLSACGDGRFDPESGEECDAGQGLCATDVCSADCICLLFPTTTVTTSSTSSSTPPTVPITVQ